MTTTNLKKSALPIQQDFEMVLHIIEKAREKAFSAVNYELISMYREIGKFVSEKVKSNSRGKSVVEEFSQYVQSKCLGIKGFSAQNIRRMKQFYETYEGNEKLSTLSREISWSNNVLIMMTAKTDEAREFYMLLTTKNKYSYRELERQLDTMLFERTMISQEKTKNLITKNESLAVLRDSYIFEFLDIPTEHKEVDLRKSIVANLRDFILEFGKDFTFVGEEYKIQVGNSDFFIDLLFYNRELACLVAIELKIDRFKPEYVGQLEFYLEALDRDIKKPNENPSIWLLLCTSKDDTVVEYALNRSVSPAVVADYRLYLPDKTILEKKLKELRDFALSD